MVTKKCVAMILAGGRGTRLGALTQFYSKPAIHFGGNHRIIDFTLNNCYLAGIDTIGILSQYFTTDLHAYISHINGKPETCSVHMLPSESAENSYTGTANAVYKNIMFIERHAPDNVLILSGDHIYNMDYSDMLAFHEASDADVTIASTSVPAAEASRFGIICAAKNGRVSGFEEKPAIPKSRLASMGIYVFKWSVLKRYLLVRNNSSQNDFGKDIIPKALSSGGKVYTYKFSGYWRDIGTVEALWQANMDLIDGTAQRLTEEYPTNDRYSSFLNGADIRQSIISGNCTVAGKTTHSVLGDSVIIERGSEVTNSVIMPNVYIGKNVKISNAIIGTRAIIMDGVEIGSEHGTPLCIDHKVCSRGISLVAPWLQVTEGLKFRANSHVDKESLNRFEKLGEVYDDVKRFYERTYACEFGPAAAAMM